MGFCPSFSCGEVPEDKILQVQIVISEAKTVDRDRKQSGVERTGRLSLRGSDRRLLPTLHVDGHGASRPAKHGN